MKNIEKEYYVYICITELFPVFNAKFPGKPVQNNVSVKINREVK